MSDESKQPAEKYVANAETTKSRDTVVANDQTAANHRDDVHLLRSVVAWGGVREVVGDDLHERAVMALDRIEKLVKDVERLRGHATNG